MFWFLLAMYCNGPVCGIAPYGAVKYEQSASCEKAAAALNKSYKKAHAKCDWGREWNYPS